MSNHRIRKNLWEKNPYCFVCERIIEDFSEATLEHIIPIAYGGGGKRSNLAVSHRFCNELKADLLCPDLWKQKIREHFDNNDIRLWRRPRSEHFVRILLQRGFADSNIALKTFEFLPGYFERGELSKDDLSFQVDFILRLRRKRQLSALIEASQAIHNFRTKPYWKIVFGLLFLEHYHESKDITSILHAIWRLSSFQCAGRNLILYSYSRSLLDICQEYEPIAFERWNQRHNQAS